MWSFGNYFAKNVVVFGFDNISLSHADNRKKKKLFQGEGPTYDINSSFGSLGKKFSINFSKENTKLCLNLLYNHDNSYLFVNGKEIYKLITKMTKMLITKMLTFQLSFA